MAGSIELWYRKTYRLAPTDPRFLDAEPETLLKEYYAYQYDAMLQRDGKLPDEFEDDDFDAELERATAEAESDNPDAWEPEIDDSSEDD
ncbi:MAG TPA: hypothetical protein VFM97_00060 [Gammaproteobacteria bacterium]|nr:hypothetical protein [Gammaproteobacteria bacterium]